MVGAAMHAVVGELLLYPEGASFYLLWSLRWRLMLMVLTYADIIQICLVIIELIRLIIEIIQLSRPNKTK
jgi:hypothetical protein